MASSETQIEPHTYVLLLNSDCYDGLKDSFEHDMHYNNTGYEEYIGSYSILCLVGLTKMSDLEDYIVSALREGMSSDSFIFVYPPSMKEEYYDHVAHKYGEAYRYSSVGSTDLENGIAYAAEMPSSVKHEMAHLSTCGTWHDSQGASLGYVKLHPDAANLIWCKN